ncbi:MAG TPA: DUF2891 family protein [Vicinamibacterales bacterium]|nr:DUF2891 family protein [Vicinamibacterales bacterium]
MRTRIGLQTLRTARLRTGGLSLCLITLIAPPAALARQDPLPPVLDRSTALWLVTLPLSCIDKLHEPPRGRGYLYEVNAVLRPDFFKTRAFYGCSDWHSAVNSTWAMVKILRLFPDLPVARLIREKLNEHLSGDAFKGEVAFFNEEGHKSFERPYGWAWLLRLYAELRSWKDADAQKWASNIEPLAKVLLERTTPYLRTLAAPMRIGTHANTAFTLKLLLEYAKATSEKELERAVVDRAMTFFAADSGCAPNLEPSGSDFFSPCLSEAALMSEVLKQPEFVGWLGDFLPAHDSANFKALTIGLDMKGTAEELKKADMLGAKAHLIGLAATRAKAFEEIAYALPPGDPRVAVYRQLAAQHAKAGIAAMYEADYAGTHWIATYILDYLISASRVAEGQDR